MVQDHSLRATQDDTFFDVSPGGEDVVRMSLPVNNSDKEQRLPIQGATGPAGDVGLPPSRPSTVASSTSTQSALPFNVTSARRSIATSDGIGQRTQHIPNLTSAAFYNPLSSKHLRDHTQRPLSPTTEASYRRSIESSQTIEQGRHNRNSNASIVTVDQQQRPLVDADAPPVPFNPQSPVESDRPKLQQDNTNARPTNNDDKQHNPPASLVTDPRTATPAKVEGPSRSPRAIGAAWGHTVRKGLSIEQMSANRHRRLSSGPFSPEDAQRHVAMLEQQQQQQQQNHESVDRNYEYYNGNAIFFLRGRLLNARSRPLNTLTALLAVSPALFYFIFSAPYLWHHVSPAIPIFFTYLFWICVSSFVHASFSDPGILPRNLHRFPPPSGQEDPLALGPATRKWVKTRSFAPTPAGQQSEALQAMEQPVKFCESCSIWRPPRAHHCRICDACIETQDHHCVWLNNCVGRRSYRYFVTFVVSGALLAFYMFASCLGQLVVFSHRNNMSFGQTIRHDWSLSGGFFLMLYSILICPYPLSLTGYHFYLMSRGETTREYLHSHKFRKQDRHRPFDLHNVWQNLGAVLCRPRPPTYMQFKLSHLAGDQRYGDKKRAFAGSDGNGTVEMNDLDESQGRRRFVGPRALREAVKRGAKKSGLPKM